MKDSLLPVASNKSNSSLFQNVCSGHVMKMVALLALLSTAGTAFGLYCFQSSLFSSKPDLTQLTSSYTVRCKSVGQVLPCSMLYVNAHKCFVVMMHWLPVKNHSLFPRVAWLCQVHNKQEAQQSLDSLRFQHAHLTSLSTAGSASYTTAFAD